MGKISRVRTGCWTCKKRHRKCDETKPSCNNCIRTNRKCEGYGIRLLFDSKRSKSKGEQVLNGNQSTKKASSPVESATSEPDQPDRSKDTSLASEAASRKRLHPISHSPSKNLEQFSALFFEDLEVLMASPMTEGSSSNDTILSSNLNGSTSDKHSNSQSSSLLNTLINGDISSPVISDFISLHNSTLDLTNKNDARKQSANDALWPTNLESEIVSFMNKTKEQQSFEGDSTKVTTKDSSLYSLSYQEENMMLKHFFKKLLPLLDAHPNSPWPNLALKYCDFDIARSCFIALACIHMHESRKGGNEYYRKGVAHINNTMSYLTQYIISNGAQFNPKGNVGRQVEEIDDGLPLVGAKFDTSRSQVSSFVILVLINVHILFTVLEKGVSHASTFYFKIFATLCQDSEFYESLMKSEKKKSLVVVLSWYDTVTAIVSPNCRLPFCNPEWYGTKHDEISTLSMMGCPGEIFKAMAKLCVVRHDIQGANADEGLLTSTSTTQAFDSIKSDLMNYRDYIPMGKGGGEYSLRLKGSQCWALAVYATLLRTTKPHEWHDKIRQVVHEFIDVYGSMTSSSPIVTQMVWPVYAIGCECEGDWEQSKLTQYMDVLYENAQMGTLHTLKNIVNRVWQRGIRQEEVLAEWLEEGAEYLPL